MYYLKKTFYLILLLTLIFILLGEQKNIPSSANSLTTQQVIELNKQKLQPGQVPELALRSKKLSQLKADRKLNLIMAFKLDKEIELRNLIQELYDQNSPNYHKWLNPEEFGKRFGRSDSEINTAINWLVSQGFTIEETWPNRLAISFSAQTSIIEKAFQLEINEYEDSSSRVFYSNSQAPLLPKELKAIASDIYGLNDAYLYKTNSKLRPFSAEQQKMLKDAVREGRKIEKNFQIGNSPIFFGPDDFALAYNTAPVVDSGIQGQGQRVAIIINSNVLDDDINLHRQLFDLPFTNVKRFVPPGLEMPPVRFQGEAELDIDSVSVIAPMAEINLILIPELTAMNIFLAEQFIINTLKIPIVSESFGGCEANVFSVAEQMLMLQGVSQGIAFFIAGGDEGAECFPGGTSGQAAINCPACYDGATAVGGTQIIGEYDFFGDLSSVRQESVWNEPPGVRFDCDGNPLTTGGGATGGGVSEKVARPSYQIMTSDFPGGVPSGTKRVIPDIALLAGNPGTAIIVNSNGFIAFGTSQSAPLWAGIMALINQAKGSVQGSPNSEIYRLGKEQFNNSGAAVFRDVTFGNNNTSPRSPCAQTGAKGFLASRGYDLVTGWGVPNVELLVKNFAPDKIAPIVRVSSPQSGDMFKIADKIRIDWQTTDNSPITQHNIDLSLDGGATFPISVAKGLAPSAQNFIFTIPNSPTTQARIRVTSIDQVGNSGFGISQGNFSIITPIQESFTLSVSPSLQTVVAGASTSFTLASQTAGNFRGEISLNVMVEPSDPTIKITAPRILVSSGNTDVIQISTSANTQGDFKLTLIGTARNSGGEQISSTTLAMLKVIQPDFSLVFDSPQLKITRGQKLSFPIRIDRIANFTGRVTVTAPNTDSLKLKLTPNIQSTTENSLSFSLKAQKSGPIGIQEVLFTGQDDLGRVRTLRLNLLIE
ncbi:MAG: S8/S53 family peptidase [Acidobacteria bacterium]|nr:S8/S53 family peptidase [Acidobacteriota bacterium]